ncbi:MAG TPA: ADYC domain-containing protein, partial [Kofleriaceae bacterium]|nr:ADYC domain-containing protein [Kofleriaceae bacterium]
TATTLLALLGCAEGPEVDETTQAATQSNGVSLNGVSLNGVSLNGVSLNGVSLNGVSLNGVSLDGVSLNGVSLDGVSLNGATLSGPSVTGFRSDTGGTATVGAVGTHMRAMLSNGTTLWLRIESAAPLTAPNADVWSYGVSYQTTTGWLPLCGANTALAVAGTWDTRAGIAGGGAYMPSTTAFTFACRAMTIAKCIELGYKPWRGYSLQLQSCVRLLRGDYCGHGTPYTVTGNEVNIYDALGVQTDAAPWLAEAEWTPAGARCITLDRRTRFYTSGNVPSCVATGMLPTASGCVSTGFRNGAVLMSELPPATMMP